MAYKGLDISGKVCLVSGGTSGIGRAIALAYAEAGAKVVAGSTNPDKVAAIKKELGGGHEAVTMNVADEASVKQAVDFTDPYYTNKLQFIAPKSVEFKTDEASLDGKVIGAQRATIAGTWLEDNLGKVVDIKLYDTQENAYLDLASGRLDGVLADTFVNWEWLKSDAGKDFEFKGDPVFDNDKIGIAVRKGDPLREKLNTALQAIIADGTYKRINDKYFPFSIY